MARLSPELITPGPLDAAVELVGGWILAALAGHRKQNARFRLMLTGGSTPVPVYRSLAQKKDVRWDLVDWFWSDERAVSPDHPDSNYALVREHLLTQVPHDPARVFRLEAELQPLERAAEISDAALRSALGDLPFDFTLLGMGSDGHIASLFPGAAELDVTASAVAAVHDSPKPPAERLSLTLPRINNSKQIIVLTAGAEKRSVADAIASGTGSSARLPAARLRPDRTIFVRSD